MSNNHENIMFGQVDSIATFKYFLQLLIFPKRAFYRIKPSGFLSYNRYGFILQVIVY
jgi:hypothetical protein